MASHSVDVPFPIAPAGCIGYVGGGMYLGNRTARNIALLKALKITHVVAIAYPSDIYPAFQYKDTFEADAGEAEINVRSVPMDDNDDDMLMVYRDLETSLKKGTSGDNKTLVQCFYGQKRSATLIALHLIENEGLTALEVMLLILPVRLATTFESNFLQNMKDLELEFSKNPKKPDSLRGMDFPGFAQIHLSKIKDENRKVVNAHLELAKELRKKQPKPVETELDVYKQLCFKDYATIPDA